MAAVLSSDQVVREDLSDALILINRRKTPVTSRMPKGERLKAMMFSWPAEKSPARRKGGIPENKDVDAFETANRQRLYGRAERWWRTPRVSVIAEKVNDHAGVSGSEYRHQVTQKTGAQKADIEAEILSDQDSAEDNGITGDLVRGLGRVINDGTLTFTDTPTAIPLAYRTPAAQIYSDVIANFTEAKLSDMLQAMWDLSGAAGEITLVVASALKRKISDEFGKYVPNKSGYTVVTVRSGTQLTDGNKKLLATGIDVFEGDFGIVDITLDPYMPSNYRGYGLDWSQLGMRPMMYCDHTELPYQGGGISGLIDSILGYEYGDPRAYIKIAPSDETAKSITAGDLDDN